jgi:hypothetical protein
MHELEKFHEARHFLERMTEVRDQRDSFNHNLSAFLTAARTVLQYAYKEAEGKNKLAWWEKETNDPVIRFFRDKRNASVHEIPVRPQAQISVGIFEQVTVSDSVSIVLQDKAGNIIQQTSSPPPAERPKADSIPAVVSHTYVFDDWKGSEDVFELSQIYLDKLGRFVEEGRSLGILT